MRRQVGVPIRHVRTWTDFPLTSFDIEIRLADWPSRVLGELVGCPVSAYWMQRYLCPPYPISHYMALARDRVSH